MAAGGLEPETFGPTSASLTAKLAITAESDKAMDQNSNDAGCAGGTETANDCQKWKNRRDRSETSFGGPEVVCRDVAALKHDGGGSFNL